MGLGERGTSGPVPARSVTFGSTTGLFADECRSLVKVHSHEQQVGLQVFRGRGNCTACHVGPNFSDEKLHNTGVAWRDGRLTDDGRFGISGNERDRGAFKTPTLREIAHTAPYMHDGSLATLEAVVDFYDDGGRLNPNLDPEIHPLHLVVEEKQALVVLLNSFSGTIREGVR